MDRQAGKPREAIWGLGEGAKPATSAPRLSNPARLLEVCKAVPKQQRPRSLQKVSQKPRVHWEQPGGGSAERSLHVPANSPDLEGRDERCCSDDIWVNLYIFFFARWLLSSLQSRESCLRQERCLLLLKRGSQLFRHSWPNAGWGKVQGMLWRDALER